ncbi:hypothetical protein [Spirosoma endbachense]|uniref:Uncharacterized protein n=1 Tax=Spirosoma endbachense TaxID=2666025 RepID=A0A6P1W0V0_9BACT|nr:hypothetical protein [Spirosoma endbachense]QHV97306.1 hypothetical protein GJR95_20860 [Spirosoma endbachense]
MDNTNNPDSQANAHEQQLADWEALRNQLSNPEQGNIPITPLALNQRQLTAWKDLKQQLLAANPENPQIGYCDQRIANIQAEINRLSE